MALKLGTQRMSEKVREFGDGEQMKAMLHDVKAQHPELTDQDFEQMSPDTLRNLLLNFQNNKNADIELNDSQIDFIFSQLYNLPQGVCLLLYLIEKITVPFFIKLLKIPIH